MKATSCLLAGLCCFTGSASAIALKTVKIDMGDVTVKLVRGGNQEQVSYDIPEDCPGTKVEVTTPAPGVTRVSHVGTRCKRGARLLVPVGVDASYDIELEVGNLTLTDPGRLAPGLSSLELKVDTGLIRSDRVTSHRINNFAGAQGALRGTGGTHRLEIHVGSGLISF